MAIRRYTAEQLYILRESPLCQRPDNLQPIESYLEYVYVEIEGVREKLRIHHSEGSPQATRKEDNAQKQRLPKLPAAALAAGQGSSPMGAFSTGRPTLPTRGSALRTNGEDVSLGPPRTMFPSSRNVPKLADVQGKAHDDSTPTDESESARSRFFSDRQLNRRSMNEKDAGAENNNARDWANVRERRGQRDGGSREEKDDGERRNGYGNRQDPRWGGQRDDKQNGERRGGWREREARRDRDQDRHEKEPEWMDEPVVKQEKELGLGMARTQDEFQKWKESMSKKSKGEPEREENVEATRIPEPAPEPKPAVAPLKLGAIDSSLFGSWENASSTPQSATTPSAGTGSIRAARAKGGKTSRFASMFKPVEPEPAPAPPLPPPMPADESTNGNSKTSAEDHEGFNRVLAMLESAKISQPTPPAAAAVPPPPPAAEQMPASPPPVIKPAGANGTIKKSRFTDMFSQKSPERLQSPQQGGVQLGDSLFGSDGPHRQQQEQAIPRTQEQASTMSPAPNGIPFNALREQQPRPSSSRNQKDMFDPPSRGAASPDVNIQNLLAQRQRPQLQSNDSQKLLNLLKKDTSGSRPQSQQALPMHGGIDQLQLQQWLASQQPSPMPQEPQAPKPRGPPQPPGHFEEQLMRNYQQEQPQQMYAQETVRRSQQRAPPGFGVHDEHAIFLQQQQQQQQLRRQQQFSEPPPPVPQQQIPGPGRRMSGHPNLPPMQIPQQQFPPDLHQLSSPTGAPPPPGFGFPHNVNIFQGAQQQQRGPPPPGFAGNAPPGFYGAPQGMPPGFQQVRSPIDGMPPNMRFNQNGMGGRPI
ncbi:hypothetical protein CLAFUW4_12647 [Fulvia fulva]|uniref:Uncharacterized protein n=1 Tax=Passalora fulva TaxID=5499 RepID=A0A9Q8PEP1_PASFU|nr:uncharacterized protein CLAFUR5_11670 [Fulvia fulva]UJO21093.1 hypothetical protein CLAFUR5_11670 [Fulvia fulva]WPV18342.1 hypothetical protein CLAFUW4_12647 [Fulvia fulva]WPV32874.1 hypothetical protein CLAFUW7_12654 [Fulvia fulva]